MADESTFFRQAAEAIVATSLNISNVDPTIKELLKRIKYNDVDFNKFSNNENDASQATTPQDTVSQQNNTITPSRITNPILQIPNSTYTQSVTLLPTPSSSNGGAMNIQREDILSTESIFSSFMDSPNENSSNRKSEGALDQNQYKVNKSTDRSSIKSKSIDKSQERKYPCSKCELVFFRSSDLRRHEKAHSLILPHICSSCGKGFARKDALKRHFNTLTCNRNRSKLMEITGGKIEEFLERAKRDGISL